MKTVFVVQHEHEWCGHDEVKFIGVYSSKGEADQAVIRLREQPGFRDWPDGFCIGEYELDKDEWAEGFHVMVTILLPLPNSEGQFVRAGAIWRPGDIYQISNIDDHEESAGPAFVVGDHVLCEGERCSEIQPHLWQFR